MSCSSVTVSTRKSNKSRRVYTKPQWLIHRNRNINIFTVVLLRKCDYLEQPAAHVCSACTCRNFGCHTAWGSAFTKWVWKLLEVAEAGACACGSVCVCVLTSRQPLRQFVLCACYQQRAQRLLNCWNSSSGITRCDQLKTLSAAAHWKKFNKPGGK